MVIVLPVVGGLLVGQITYYFAREAKGHGVPEVMDAIYRRGSIIRRRVAGAKTVASACTIGSGGSAGMEGPIIQIGAAIGSTAGQYLDVPRRQMNILVACGVSAGIAAIFNAPIAGVLFALEIFLRDFSFRTFSPVVFSSVISCSVTHAIRFQDAAIFEVSISPRRVGGLPARRTRGPGTSAVSHPGRPLARRGPSCSSKLSIGRRTCSTPCGSPRRCTRL